MAKIIITSSAGTTAEHGLDKPEIKLGRTQADNDIVLDSVDASRNHAKLIREGNSWFVEDMKSTNGTRVNGRKVTKFELADGDEIQVGTLKIQFLAFAEAAAAAAPADLDLDLEISLEEDAHLRFLGGSRKDEKVKLSGRLTIGRNPTNTLALNEKGISGNHCEIVKDGDRFVLRDLGSTNGTLVNGEKTNEAKLSPGDVIKVGVAEFVFGEGENEGADTLVTAVTTLTASEYVSDDVFAISEQNLKKKQKVALGGWLVLFLAIGAGVAVWVSKGKKGELKDVPVQNVAGNLIAQGASFEIDPDGGDTLVTDSDSVEYEESAKYRRSGRTSLLVTAKGTEGAHAITFKQRIEAIGAGDRLALAGFFRTQGLGGGAAGLTMLWYDADGRPLGKTDVNAPNDLSSFAEVKAVVKPPFGTAAADFGINVRDARGTFFVDDVSVVRLPTDQSRGVAAFGFEATLEASGLFALSRDSDEIVDHAGFVTAAGDVVTPVGGWMNLKSASETAVAGDLIGPGGAAFGTLGMTTEKTAAGVRFSGELKGSVDNLMLGFAVDLGEGLATVAPEGAARHLDAFERKGVTAIVLATGPRAVRLGFKEPITCSVKKTKGANAATWLLLPVAKKDGGAAFAVEMQLDFEGERESVMALADEAQKAEIVEKAYGRALKAYRDLYDRFPFRKDLADRAEQRIAELQKKGEEQLARFDKRAQEIHFFKTYDIAYDGFMRDATALAEAYAGSDIADRAKTLIAAMVEANAKKNAARNLTLAQNHLARAKDLIEGDRPRPTLARGLFQSVLDLAPDSPLAEEAKAGLSTVEQLIRDRSK